MITSSENFLINNPSVSLPELSPIEISKNIKQFQVDLGQNSQPLSWQAKLDSIKQRPELQSGNVYFNRDLYKRYTDTYFGNSVFLDPRYYDNEEINARRQSEWNKLGMGTIKLIPMFGSSFAAFFTSRPWDYNNEHTREFAKIMDNWETMFPNFVTKEEQFSKNPIKGIIPFTTGWGNFWGDKIIKNIGFMAGAFVAAAATELAVTAGTGFLGTVPMAAVTAARFSMLMGRMRNGFTGAHQMARALALGEQGAMIAKTAQTLPKALQLMQNYTTGQRMIHGAKSLAMAAWAAQAEASIETVGLQQTVFEEYLAKYREIHGTIPTEEEQKKIQDITIEAANYQFALNTAIIWGANMVQWGNLFKPTKLTKGVIGGEKSSQSFARTLLGGDEYIDEAGKAVIRDKTRLGKAASFLGGGGKFADNVSEGAQEMLQYSFEKGAEGLSQQYYNNYLEGLYDPNRRMAFGDVVMANIYGMKEAFGSKEGWESFIVGFLTGYPVHGMIKGFNKLKGNKSEAQAKQESIDAFNSFDLKDLMSNSPQVQEFLERNKIAMNDALAQQFIAEQIQLAVDNNDVFMAKNLNHDALINFVRTGIQLGKFDARLVQLDTLKDLTDDAFVDHFGLEYSEENSAKARAMVDKTIAKAKQMKDIIEVIDNSLPNEFSYKTELQQWQAAEMVKETLIRNTLLIDNMNNRIPNVIQDIMSTNPMLSTDVLDILINPNILQERYLDNLTKEIKLFNSSLEDTTLLDKETRNKTEAQRNAYQNHVDKVQSLLNKLNDVVGKTIALPEDASKLSEQEKAKAVQEAFGFKQDQFEAQSAVIAELMQEVLAFRISQTEKTSFDKAQELYDLANSKDLISSIIDLRRLQNAMSLLIDQNGNLQTPQGKKKAVQKYVDLHKNQEDQILEIAKRASYQEFLKNPDEASDMLREENAVTLSEIDTLKQKLEELQLRLKAEKQTLKAFQKEWGDLNQALGFETNPELKDEQEARRDLLENTLIPQLEVLIPELEQEIKELKAEIKALEDKQKETEATIEHLTEGKSEPPTQEEINTISESQDLGQQEEIPEEQTPEDIESGIEQSESEQSQQEQDLGDTLSLEPLDPQGIIDREGVSFFAPYDFFKTTQGDEGTSSQKARLKRNSIFESFLDLYSNAELLQSFLDENDLKLVLKRTNTDPSLYDGIYFDTLETIGIDSAEKDRGIMLAVVHKDTNTVARLRRVTKATPQGDSIVYEVIPEDQHIENENQRGYKEFDSFEETNTEVVSIIGALPVKENRKTLDAMAATRVFLKMNESLEEAVADIKKSLDGLKALRARLNDDKNTISHVDVFVQQVSPGVNHVLDFSDKKATMSLNDILAFEYADIEIGLTGTRSETGFQTKAGIPYVVLKNGSNEIEFYLPVVIPTLETIKVGNKPVLDNLADILFVLQSANNKDFIAKLELLNLAMADSSPTNRVSNLFDDILYKPRGEKAKTIYLNPQKTEYVILNWSITEQEKDPGKQFFYAERVREVKGEKQVTRIRVDLNGSSKQKSLKTQVQIRKSLELIFSGLRLNVREPYLRRDKNKQFGYIQVDVADNPKADESRAQYAGNGFTVRPVNNNASKEQGEYAPMPLDYRKFLSSSGAVVRGRFQDSFDQSNKEQPFNRIGKSILFSPDVSNYETELKKKQELAEFKRIAEEEEEKARQAQSSQPTQEPAPVSTQGSGSDIEAKKADIERRRQDELKRFEGRRANSIVRFNPDGENMELTEGEIEDVENLINTAKEKGLSVDRTQKLLQTNGFVQSVGNSATAFREFLKARLSGEIDARVNGEFLNLINAKYDAELARELYKEIKAGKLVTDMTIAEQKVVDKYVTEELRKSVDAELDDLEQSTQIQQEPISEQTITYTPKGKTQQIYTIRGNQIFNSKGQEVFKNEGADRTKIFTNLKVRNKEAEIVEHRGKQYVVDNTGEIVSVTTGKVMQWGEENGDRKAILAKSTLYTPIQPVSEQVRTTPQTLSPTPVAADNLSENNDNSSLIQSLQEESEDDIAAKIQKAKEERQKQRGTRTKPNLKTDSSKLDTRIEAPEITQDDIDKVKSIFGNDVNIKQLYDVANSNAWATWTAAAITLYKGSNRSDLYHEAWHNFSQLYLTKEEKIKLYDEVRNKVEDLKDATDKEVEEHVAREFSKYAITDGKYDLGKLKETKSVFRKILDFLKKLFGLRNNQLENLFETLYKGQIQNRKPSTENILYSSLNSEINNNFSSRERDRVITAVDGLFAQVLQDNQVPLSALSALSPEAIEYLYEETQFAFEDIQDALIDENGKLVKGGKVIAKNTEKILDNWEDVKRMHFENSNIVKPRLRNFELNEDGEIVSKEVDEDERGRNAADFKESSMIGFHEQADPEVVAFIETLPQYNRNGNLVIDKEYGTPVLVNSEEMITTLIEALHGTLPFDLLDKKSSTSMITKLEKLSKKHNGRYKTIEKALIPRLLIFMEEATPTTASLSLFAKFVKAMTRPKNELQLAVVERFDENNAKAPADYGYSNSVLVNGKFATAKEELRTNFFLAPVEKDSIFSVDPLTEERIILNDSNTVAQLKDLLDKIKTTNPTQALKRIGLYHEFFTEFEKEEARVLIQKLIKALPDSKKGITDIMQVLQTKETYPETIKIVKQIVDADPSKATNSYQNADGQLENEINQWSRINFLAAGINSGKSLSELVSGSEFQFLQNNKNNSILQMFFEDKGAFKRKKVGDMIVYNKNGVLTKKNPNQSESEGVKSKNMHVVEAAIVEIQQLLTENNYSTMQLSDKSSFYSVTLPELLYDRPALVADKLYDAFENSIRNEIEIVRQFKQDNADPSNPKGLARLEKLRANIVSNGSLQFGAFREIFNEDLRAKLLDSEDNVSAVLRQNKTEIGKQLFDYFRTSSQEFKDYMNEKSALGEYVEKNTILDIEGNAVGKKFTDHINIPGYSRDGAIEAFLVNQFLFNIATSEILFGNTYSHKDPFKRIAGGTSTGTPPITDDIYLTKLLQVPTETLRTRFTNFYSQEFGVQLRQEQISALDRMKQNRFVVLKDETPKSVYKDSYLKATDKIIEKLETDLKEASNEDEGDKIRNRINSYKEKRKAIEKGYRNPNEADAFGAMSLDFFRTSMNQMGAWNPKLEKVYKKATAWGLQDLRYQYYIDLRDNATSVSEIQTYGEKAREALEERERNELSPEEIKLVEFSVQKFQYFGDVFNPELSNYTETAFHKFELMPLIPQLVSGTQWQKHVERMLIEDVDYILFDSGNKLEKDIVKDNFYEDEGRTTVKDVMTPDAARRYQEGNKTYNIRIGNVMNLKEQVKMDTEPHSEEILFGTQIRKLVFNFYSEGRVDTGNADFDAKIEKLKSDFDSNIAELVEIEKQRVYKGMSLTTQNGDFVIKDMEQFMTFLKKELEKKNINKEAYNYFALNQDKQFARDIDVSIYRKAMENVIVSIINKKIVSQKMKGEQKVQIPSTGFQSYRTALVKAPNVENGTNGLRFYGIQESTIGDQTTVIRKMQVKIALKPDTEFAKLLRLRHEDGNPIGTDRKNFTINRASIARLNYMISKGLIDTRSITMIGYRIPTQEHNSIEIMEVAEFLDPLFGSGIIVPTEITAKAGSDFDIDKMNTFFPSIDDSGNYIAFEAKNRTQERLRELEAERDDMLELFQEFRQTNREEKQKLIQLGNTWMELKNFVDLLRFNTEDFFTEGETLDLAQVDTFKKVYYAQLRESLYVDENDRKNILREYKKAMTETQGSQQFWSNQNKITRDVINYFYSLEKEIRERKSAYQNGTIAVIEQAILNEQNFINFITPNATYVLDDAVAELIETLYPEYKDASGKINLDVKLTKMFSYLESIKKRDSLLEQKDVLGISAQANVYSQLFRQANLQMQPFETRFRIPTTEEGNFSLAKDVTENGIPKATIFGQTINFNVDAANSPEFSYVNTGIVTASVMMLMHHLGIDPELTLFFVNQPMIRRFSNFEKLRRNARIIDLKKREKDKFSFKSIKPSDKIDEQMTKAVLALYEIEDKDFDIVIGEGETKQKIDARFLFKKYTRNEVSLAEKAGKKVGDYKWDFDVLYKTLTGKDFVIDMEIARKSINVYERFKKDSAFREEIKKDKRKQDSMLAFYLGQVMMLQDFLTLSEESQDLRKVQDAVKYDTGKSLSVVDAQTRIQLYEELQKSGKFINLDKLRFESTTSPFAVQHDIVNLMQMLMPVTSGKEVTEFVVDKLNTVFAMKPTKTKQKFQREFVNDLVQFIFQTMHNDEFKTYFKLVFNTDYEIQRDKDGNETQRSFNQFHRKMLENFYKRLITLKNAPENQILFEKYPLLRNAFINASPLRPEYKNVGISFASKEIKVENDYIDQWRELKAEHGRINPANTQSQTITAFMDEFALFGFLQSGLGYSYLSYSRIADNEVIANLLGFAKQEFLKQVEELGWDTVLNYYYEQFIANNNVFRTYDFEQTIVDPDTRKKISNTSPRQNTGGIESFRGKFYKWDKNEVEELSGKTLEKEQNQVKQQQQSYTLNQNVEVVNRYSNADLKANPNKIYVFGDNTQRVGTGGQAQIRNNSNAFGIATKLKPTMNADAFMKDEDFESNKQIIDSDIAKIKAQNKTIVLPKDGFGTGLAKLKEKAPQTYQYLKQRLLQEFGFDNDTGKLIKPLETQIEKEKEVPGCSSPF